MISVKHAKISLIEDDPVAVEEGQVVPSDWNEEHNVDGLGTAAEANVEDFASAAQGALADTAVQPADLATVATSGSYNDLLDLPTLGDTLGGYAVEVTAPQISDLVQFAASDKWINSSLLDGGNF